LKWQSGAAYLRRLIAAPGTFAMRADQVGASALWLILDTALCYAALAAGMSARAGQTLSFIVTAAVSFWFSVRPKAAASGRVIGWTSCSLLVVVSVLAVFLRSGILDLIQGWGWPVPVAVLAAVLATAAVTVPGYSQCLSRARGTGLDDAGWRGLAMSVVAYVFALRLVYCGQVDLLPEEAYYWNYAQHLDIGYLDHPPMVAWLIRLGTVLFGDTEFGVRIPALCCGAVTSLFLFRLTRNLFGEPAAWLALILAQLLPFFFMAGLLMTPDAPLTAAWAATLYFLERALIADGARAWRWAGVSMGAGLLSKYTIGLLGLAALLFTLVDPPSRRWLRRFEPYAAALLALAIFTPVIVWNAEHDWASFAFQTSRRLAEHPRFALHRLIGSALVLITPTGLIAAGIALTRRKPATAAVYGAADSARAWRLIRISVLVPLVVFMAFSLRHEVKLDWTGAPWTAAIPLLAFGIVESRRRLRNAPRPRLPAAWLPTLIVMLITYGAGLQYLALGIPRLGFTQHTELIPVGWRDLGRQIDGIAADVERRYGGSLLIVGMDRYAIASELAFYSPDRSKSVARTSTGHLFDGVGLMYERWFPIEQQAGRTLLLIAWDPSDLAALRLEPHVQSVEPLQEGTLMRDGRIVRRYYYRIAHGYRGSPRAS
jgi:dolichol-phosphate mannosyltransferase